MKRALIPAAVVLGVLVLGALFWASAPSVEPVGEVSAADTPDPRVRRHGLADREASDREPGPAAGLTEEERSDVLSEIRGDKGLGLRGGLQRMKSLLRALEDVEDPPIPQGLTAAEEDALIAGPIAKKAKILAEMEIDARVIGSGENALLGARSEVLLSQAHEHMAGFLVDRPVPSYLQDEGRESYLQALDARAATQEDKADAARGRARAKAETLPPDHPIHGRLK